MALPALAESLGVGALWLKDETARFGLPAFKSLGVEFAVHRLAERGELAGVTTLVCASAGNHGRAVARAARSAGLAATIFLDADVAPARVAAIAAEGADVVRVGGSYDDAVRDAAAHAAATGGLVVSDTSWDGYDRIPRDIMLGYTRLMDEAAAAWAGHGPPDVMLVQAGVGGLLAAVASWSAWTFGPERPRLVAVEPTLAACVQASARAGRPTTIDGPLTTVMAGLRCGEVSPLAFEAVAPLVDGYLAVDDDWTRHAMRRLARPEGDRPAACGRRLRRGRHRRPPGPARGPGAGRRRRVPRPDAVEPRVRHRHRRGDGAGAVDDAVEGRGSGLGSRVSGG